MLPEAAGVDPSDWPELRSGVLNGKKETVHWGKGMRSEEEEYLAKLESKLARVKTSRGDAVESPQQRDSPKDLFDTSFSLASSPSEYDYHSDNNSENEIEEEEIDEANVEPIESNNPGLPLLWDQPPTEPDTPEEMEEKLEDELADNRSLPVTPDRSNSLAVRNSSERPGLASNDSKVRFFSRVRVTSGRRAVSSPYRQRSPHIKTPIAPKSFESSSIASSVTMSLRGTPTTSWLFPSMTPIGTPSEAVARDYFSIVSPASSERRSGTMTPRDPEIEEIAAQAARARALTWAPNRRTSSSDAFGKVRRRVDVNGNIVLKTEDGVIWGSWKTRLTTMKWWTWKIRRVWYAIQKFWCYADNDDDDDDDDEERRVFIRE